MASSPFLCHVTSLIPFSHASSPSSAPYHIHLHHQHFSLFTISTTAHPPYNASQPHIYSSIKCGLAAAIPYYSSHRIIHQIHVLGSVKSPSVGPTRSQDQHYVDIPMEARDDEPSPSGQRRSIGVVGPNFREKLRRFLTLKNGHISGLEDRIRTLERKNGDTFLDLWRFNYKYSRLKRELHRELFRLKIERSCILLLLFFL
jgi:hypothetical protein